MAALPAALEISDIKPEIKFCMRNKQDFVFKHDDAESKLFKVDHIRTAKRFVFVTHGFLCNINTEWLNRLKDAIFKFEQSNRREDSVVAIVGWGGGADPGTLVPLLISLQLSQRMAELGHESPYLYAAANSQRVGAWLGQIVKTIWNWGRRISRPGHGPLPTPEIISIGHSLGAHLMGAAGRTSWVFDEIIGLDPAGPQFETGNFDKRLKKEDAKFVQVIHTDGYYTRIHAGPNHYGTMEPLGHVDFYPNWGYEQLGVEKVIAGSHSRVTEFFIWSITNPGKFRTNQKYRKQPEANKEPELETRKSRTTAEMGYHARRDLEGCYVILTAAQAPWNIVSGIDPKTRKAWSAVP